jgi:hypothetical protein
LAPCAGLIPPLDASVRPMATDLRCLLPEGEQFSPICGVIRLNLGWIWQAFRILCADYCTASYLEISCRTGCSLRHRSNICTPQLRCKLYVQTTVIPYRMSKAHKIVETTSPMCRAKHIAREGPDSYKVVMCQCAGRWLACNNQRHIRPGPTACLGRRQRRSYARTTSNKNPVALLLP